MERLQRCLFTLLRGTLDPASRAKSVVGTGLFGSGVNNNNNNNNNDSNSNNNNNNNAAAVADAVEHRTACDNQDAADDVDVFGLNGNFESASLSPWSESKHVVMTSSNSHYSEYSPSSDGVGGSMLDDPSNFFYT